LRLRMGADSNGGSFALNHLNTRSEPTTNAR
jgi:hypothetical protein